MKVSIFFVWINLYNKETLYYSQNAKICWNFVQSSCILYINVLQCVSKGFAANSRGIETGGGTNYQCLYLWTQNITKCQGKIIQLQQSYEELNMRLEVWGFSRVLLIIKMLHVPDVMLKINQVLWWSLQKEHVQTPGLRNMKVYEWSNICNSTL